MLLVNHMLDCADLEERVVLRADFSFLNLEGVIRVRDAVRSVVRAQARADMHTSR